MATEKSYGAKVADEAADVAGTVRGTANAAYEIGKRTVERAEEKIDDLSRFGRERPLLAIGIAFAAGYLTAKLFSR